MAVPGSGWTSIKRDERGRTGLDVGARARSGNARPPLWVEKEDGWWAGKKMGHGGGGEPKGWKTVFVLRTALLRNRLCACTPSAASRDQLPCRVRRPPIRSRRTRTSTPNPKPDGLLLMATTVKRIDLKRGTPSEKTGTHVACRSPTHPTGGRAPGPNGTRGRRPAAPRGVAQRTPEPPV